MGGEVPEALWVGTLGSRGTSDRLVDLVAKKQGLPTYNTTLLFTVLLMNKNKFHFTVLSLKGGILEKFQGQDFQKFCFTVCACSIYNYLEFILLLCC